MSTCRTRDPGQDTTGCHCRKEENSNFNIPSGSCKESNTECFSYMALRSTINFLMNVIFALITGSYMQIGILTYNLH